MATTKIVFIRHGETDWNLERKWQGHADIPLNAAGVKQALEVAESLKGYRLGALLSSDLLRARQTAELIAERTGSQVQVTDRLREVDVGMVEGWTQDRVESHLGHKALEKWRSIEPDDLVFGFPSGESKKEALWRVKSSVLDFIRDCRYLNLGIVFHGMVMRTLLHSLFPEIRVPLGIRNGEFIEATYYSQIDEWRPGRQLDELMRMSSQVTADGTNLPFKVRSWW